MMDEQESYKKDNTLLYLLVGAIVGGLIAYVLLRCKMQPPIQTIQTSIPQLYENNLRVIEQKLNTLDNKIQLMNYYDTQPLSQPEKVQIMENDEDWNFKTDEKGKIQGVRVHRKLFDVNKKVDK